MQLRRHAPLIILLLVVIMVAGLFGLSHVYTPAPKQTEMVEEVRLDQLTDGGSDEQPAEYP